MNNNVFLKDKKYNPDIASNYSKALNDRKNSKFEYNNKFINNNNQNEKSYNQDSKSDEIEILIKKKLDEREKQEFNFKPSKNLLPSSNPNDFNQFSNLKVQQVEHEKNIKEKDNNFTDILDDLKSLGILK